MMMMMMKNDDELNFFSLILMKFNLLLQQKLQNFSQVHQMHPKKHPKLGKLKNYRIPSEDVISLGKNMKSICDILMFFI